MKYRDLIQFEPINEVIKFNLLQSDHYCQSLVRNFVFSDAYIQMMPTICDTLDYTRTSESFGLQIVGNYGTGKSHLMSLLSIVAEDEHYLPLVQNDKARAELGKIAGKYKVIRFELVGNEEELWNIVAYQVDRHFQEWGVEYSLSKEPTVKNHKEKLSNMMAHFEEAYPDKGLMIVIDEMLEYLKGHTEDRLNRDLAALRALGEYSDKTKFRQIFGVQELIYKVRQFVFAAEMLQHANARYKNIEITNQDVQFVVQQRLLHKNEKQKEIIRQHLGKFTQYFSDMHVNLENYVNLFPVHPRFFENFQQIKICTSQREVLKTLTKKFAALNNEDVPENEPGLICYDHYWDDLNVPSMMTDSDVRRVSEIMVTIYQQIKENFIGTRQKKATLAHRIANACAVKILQDSLDNTNGVSAENLIDDLCYLDANSINREFLIDTINTTARQIVTATVGQYFEKNETNQEYHLRIKGGVNYEQRIKDYIQTMSDDRKDSYFYNYLCEFLPIGDVPCRRGFKIYRHNIEWKSRNTMLDGYIFFGNPNERGTTQPELQFYIYFMPLFNKQKMVHGDESDSIYIHVDKYSQEFKELMELYAAAEELTASVDSSQKTFYEQFRKRYEEKISPIFQHDFMQSTEIYYQGERQNITPQMMAGSSKEQIISNIASTLLEDYFCQQLPNYPKFTLLLSPLTKENRTGMVKAARQKISAPNMSNRDGEAILAGLGLLQENELNTDSCIYALSIRDKLESKGEGQVLNRDEILHQFYNDDYWKNIWLSNDYQLNADFEFLVLMAMVARGEIEIVLPSKTINAVNLKDAVELPYESFYSFTHIARPKGMDIALVREVFLGVLGKDMISQVQNQEIYSQMVSEARAIAAKAVRTSSEISNGIYLDNHIILSELEADTIRNRLDALANFCDKIQNYASPTKIRNLPREWTVEGIHNILDAKKKISNVEKMQSFANDFRSRTSYLMQARQYMTDEQMKSDVDNALVKISEIVKSINDEQKVGAYKAELDELMNRYADWYLDEYNRLHITELQDVDKRKIMNSNDKNICDLIASADQEKGYVNISAEYQDWNYRMGMLTVRSSSVNKKAILSVPYQGFNPTQFMNKQLPELSVMKKDLENLVEKIDNTLHAILSDRDLLRNKEILDDNEQGLLDRFNNNREELTTSNAARLVEIIDKLHHGIKKITIKPEDFRKVFNRPMTPGDAVKAFKKYIDIIANGDNNGNIRIIIK